MDKTMELIQLAHQGDEKAREQVVLNNVGLVWSVVKHFSNRGYDLEDLFQIGSIGLLKAIDKFNFEFDVKFSTYAVPMITGEIKRFLRDDGMIKVSRSMKELGMKVKNARERLNNQLGREPDLEELSAEVGASKEEIAASLDANAEVESLYREVGFQEDKSVCLLDRIPDESGAEEQMLNRVVLKELLLKLPEKDREVIMRRYFDNQTQSQIAKAMNISQVQVSRLEKKILLQMREYLHL